MLISFCATSFVVVSVMSTPWTRRRLFAWMEMLADWHEEGTREAGHSSQPSHPQRQQKQQKGG